VSARFFLDASVLGVAHRLESEVDGIVYPGHPDWPFPQDVSDAVWLSFVGDSGWCAVVRDKKIRYRTSERAALQRHLVRAVVVATNRNLTIAENGELLRENWQSIAATLSRPPALYHLTSSGLRSILRY
jgi:hypothetical protein